VDRRAYIQARLGATTARCGAVFSNAASRHLVTLGCAVLTHFGAQFADVSGEMRIARHKIGAHLARLGTVFRRLNRPGIHAATGLQRHTALLALFTSFNALLHFLRNCLGRQDDPSGIWCRHRGVAIKISGIFWRKKLESVSP
jgi:hypothetical protein